MPSEVMDQRRMSLLSDELRFPTERQVGFWKPELVSDSRGIEGMPLLSWSNLSNSVSLSPMEKLHPIGPSSRERRELSQQYLFKDQKAEYGLENHLVGGGSVNSWRASDQDFGLRSDLSVGPSTVLMGGNKVDMNQINFENSLFSSSLSDLLDRNLKLSSNVASLGQSINTMTSNLEEEDPLEYSEEIEAHAIGNLLPDDDDDLFSGVIEDIGYDAEPSHREEIDDDIFCSGGGIELGDSDRVIGGLDSPLASEHPFGEHPSRTLFVRNINSNIEDSELRMLFQQYGDIRTLYTACKHRGFVMISYHDIRAAKTAIKLLQNKLFKGRKLDIHFSIPKENPSDKDINQGTLVIFNLDSSVSNDDLLHIFGVYGEIKEIRETPHKRHHKFVEFYDIRAAEAALRALNRRDIAGKKIKLEPSRSGGSRRGLLQQSSPELELEESSGSRQNLSPSSSPIGSKGFIPLSTIASGFDNVLVHLIQSAATIPSNSLSQINSLVGLSFHGISSVTSVGNHSEPGHSFGPMELGFQGMPVMTTGIPYNSSSIMPGMAINIASQPVEGVDKRYIHRVSSGSLTSRSFDHNEGAYGGPGNGSCPVQGPPYMWNNSNASHHFVGPVLWGNSSSFMNNIPSLHPQHMCRLPRAPSHMLNPALPVHGTPHVGPAPSVNPPLHRILHVGSAPSVNPPPLYDWQQLFIRDPAELPALHASSLGSVGFPHNSQTGPLELAPHNTFIHAKGNGIDHVGISSPHQRGHMLNVRTRRSDPNANVVDNKKQFELDVDRIIHGEDSRTTLMIKNIPNKYTSKMLLASIDEHHKGTYNFIYLPIDFKNKCNVGYAFINMIEPQQIIPFFQAFNGKKWEKFNSEKVAVLAYARIQGKAALITHFQNSSLMNEDKRCRPILFCSDGPNAGDQEPFPMGTNIRSRPGRSKTFINEESNEGSPSTSPTQADLASSSKILE